VIILDLILFTKHDTVASTYL